MGIFGGFDDGFWAATGASAESGSSSYWSEEALVKLQVDVETQRNGVSLYEYVSISDGNNVVFYVAEKAGEPVFCHEYHGDKGPVERSCKGR